jgi:hypothetical protein
MIPSNEANMSVNKTKLAKTSTAARQFGIELSRARGRKP